MNVQAIDRYAVLPSYSTIRAEPTHPSRFILPSYLGDRDGRAETPGYEKVHVCIPESVLSAVWHVLRRTTAVC